ncbi:MAG TPA: HAD-IIIC family phosphatase [Tepidisphaeraceae bacterium]|jgi:FkbH-like protein|nr:HAD-IIIC family phosphatase [Tepidisphaeraceae bacterium]
MPIPAVQPQKLTENSAPEPAPAAPAAQDRAHIAQVLERTRHEAALRFLDSVAGWEKYAPQIAACRGDVASYVRREFYVLVDYLALLLRTGDSTYRDLYVGEKVKQAYWETESSADQQLDRRRQILDADRRGLRSLLEGELSAGEWAAVDVELAEISRIVTTRARHTPEVLLVGDCLFLDVMAFLVGPALEDGVSVNPTFLTTKNPAELRNALRKMAGRKFDLVFYSPFTYEFSPEFARLMEWRQAASGRAKVWALVDSAMENVVATLDVLTELFECNIFVHNAANVRRHDASLAERAKNLVTHKARKAARDRANAKLAEYVVARNSATFDHLFVLDETALLNQHGEHALGRLFYDSDLQHPAAMGKWLAGMYRDVLAVHSHLLKRKLVVCDLDNTLWKGVIGEGAVEHYADKQRILKRLQAKGVVLAINSKNDPKNVKWEGGVLCADDFVCSQINWDNKVANLKRIGQILNLKTKDFVFIDDRTDEREMVKMAIPEVHVLDATADRAWRLLDLWSQYLSSQGETDRTQFYKQKEQRESFLHTQAAPEEDQGALFAKLGITVTVRDAKKADLKRVAELINRTSQFNTNASRTTVREAIDWLAAGDRRILVVDSGDKFGTMGTVCIAVVHTLADRIEIPVFVLSCRVFGYGIEDVVVNAVKCMAREKNLPIVGPFTETAHNEPCRKVYPNNGFTREGPAWVYNGNDEIKDPAWLSVRFENANG